jgi:type II secretory pathway pseudopilin PulG
MHRRGFALLETLVALLVVSFGLLVLGRAQTRLWASVDLARDQAEALALAQADLEHQREQAAPSLAAHDTLAAAPEQPVPVGATVYQFSRSVEHDPALPLAALGSLLRWQDREGHWHRLSLHTLLARQDRRTRGWLALAPDSRNATLPDGRHAAVPPEARRLEDGRTAFKPRTDQPDTWIFDPATGRIVATCTAPAGLRNDRLQATDLGACTAVDARLLSGWIGYTAADARPTVLDAERPNGPVLPTDLRLSASGPSPPAWRCLAGDGNEPHPDGALPYWCRVQATGSPATWSGRLDLVPVGWTLAGSPDADAQARRVCRYSADRDGNGRIDNTEHPATYANVQHALLQQNFLVVPAAADCPVDGPARLDPGSAFNAVDDTTVAHQP